MTKPFIKYSHTHTHVKLQISRMDEKLFFSVSLAILLYYDDFYICYIYQISFGYAIQRNQETKTNIIECNRHTKNKPESYICRFTHLR